MAGGGLKKDRAPETHFVNFTIDREAHALLHQFAPGSKSIGHFISRLVYEHAARLEERQRLGHGGGGQEEHGDQQN